MPFWIVAATMVLFAALFVFWPFLRANKYAPVKLSAEDSSRLEQNVAIFKEREAELKQDLEAGRIDASEFGKLLLELQRGLLEDADKHAANSASGLKGAGIVTAALFVVTISVSLWWYQQEGALSKLAQADAMQFSDADMAKARAAAEQGDANALVEQLYSKLQQAPDNMEGWGLLARSAMNMERYDLAEQAYVNIIRVMEQQDANPAPVYGLLAQARYFGGQGRMTQAVQDALNKALTLDANENNALGLHAIHAFQSRNYAEAVSFWQRILASNPDHPSRASIEAGIARAQNFWQWSLRPGLLAEASLVSQRNSALDPSQRHRDRSTSKWTDRRSYVPHRQLVDAGDSRFQIHVSERKGFV
ncbi:MAG: c-type cytochrome biogenesis protein CcmI [Oleiphilaceae bacterium]|nr:c-type cytochrome biogenesis protein CcmI [Oleiphilaceae bacterium]